MENSTTGFLPSKVTPINSNEVAGRNEEQGAGKVGGALGQGEPDIVACTSTRLSPSIVTFDVT